MSSIDGALRAHAAGSLAAVAAAELLIAGAWPDRDDFAGFITVTASPGSGLTVAIVDWEAAAAAAAPGGGLPCSGASGGCCRSPPASRPGSPSTSATPSPAWTAATPACWRTPC